MKKIALSLLSLHLLTIASNSIAQGSLTKLIFSSFNIRRGGDESNKDYSWEKRQDKVIETIKTINPDIICFQEVVDKQMQDLSMALPEYGYFGLPRSATMTSSLQKWVMQPRGKQDFIRKLFRTAEDERNLIFYKKGTFILLEDGDFGINPRGILMPASLPRICTWGKFQELKTKKIFYVYNTHLDNSSSLIRRKQLKLIMSHIKKNTKGIPTLFMGDLNTELKGKQKSKIIKSAGFFHTKDIANQIVGPKETRTGWDNKKLKTIDHIFFKPSHHKPGSKNIKKGEFIEKYEVFTTPKLEHASDHRPVVITLKL